MEFISGRKIKNIFLDKCNWLTIYCTFLPLIRFSIIYNVTKLLACGTDLLGFHTWGCLGCGTLRKVPHTCKSRFCSSCGKKASDQWIQTNLIELPTTTWQHITFTLPQEFREFFWCNRHLFNLLFPIPAQIITEYAAAKGVVPGIFAALHTFGRDLKKNVHFHVSTTLGGLSLCKTKWMSPIYIDHRPMKARWKARVIAVFRDQFKAGTLKLPPQYRHMTTYRSFNSWLDMLYQKNWVVHLSKPSSNHKTNIEYLGRYIKRPPLGETRINKYDGEFVTFEYFEHHVKQYQQTTIPALEFIKRLIAHIPDYYFRVIRYYNWLSNRTRGKLLPLVRKLLEIEYSKNMIVQITWRQMILKIFDCDPLICNSCQNEMVLMNVRFGKSTPELMRLQVEIASGIS